MKKKKGVEKTVKFVSMMLLIFFIWRLEEINANAENTSGKSGDHVTWEYDDASKTLVISGTGDMWDFKGDHSSLNYEVDDSEWDIDKGYVKKIS